MSDCFLSLTIQFYYSYPLNSLVVVRKVYIAGDCGERPRNDVYEVQGLQCLKIRKHREQPYNPEYDRAHDHYDGWHDAFSDAPGGGCGIVHEG